MTATVLEVKRVTAVRRLLSTIGPDLATKTAFGTLRARPGLATEALKILRPAFTRLARITPFAGFTTVFFTACASTGSAPAAGNPSPPPAAVVTTTTQDSAARRAQGAGSLRQDAISLRFQLRGVQARMFPMDESVISLLSPDSYRSMRDVLLSQNEKIQRARISTGVDKFSIWYVSFFATDPEARFSPSEVVIRAAGRDFRPEIIPLSAGFAQQRIPLGQSQTALYLFEAAFDLGQPLEVAMEDVRSTDWASILLVLDRERIRLRERRDTLPLGTALSSRRKPGSMFLTRNGSWLSPG